MVFKHKMQSADMISVLSFLNSLGGYRGVRRLSQLCISYPALSERSEAGWAEELLSAAQAPCLGTFNHVMLCSWPSWGRQMPCNQGVINPGGFWVLPRRERERATVSRCQGTRITRLATGSGVYQHLRRTKRPSDTITSSPCHRLFFPVVPVAIMPLPACSRSISSFISQPMFSVPGCPPMGRGISRTQEGWWKHVDDEIRGILPRRRPGTPEREAFMSVAICPIRPQSGFGEIG